MHPTVQDREIADLQKRIDELTFALIKSDLIRVGYARLLECARNGLAIASRLTDDDRVLESAKILEDFFRGES
ncbi:hypothetical protein AMR42_14435 [Limnothrix sp. PR1529]|nr:hypothetical protein BCR12_05755 [Limnothrix sp. P13C2]PIB07317.1 hypothetical protein AMR42_14435 [Limnothrix sp. PR1529]